MMHSFKHHIEIKKCIYKNKRRGVNDALIQNQRNMSFECQNVKQMQFATNFNR